MSLRYKSLGQYFSSFINNPYKLKIAWHAEGLGKLLESPPDKVFLPVSLIKLNNFDSDFKKIIKNCVALERENKKKYETHIQSRALFKDIKQDEFVNCLAKLYRDAEKFELAKPFGLYPESLLLRHSKNPFIIDPKKSNEDNVFQALEIFLQSFGFFKDYINGLYEDLRGGGNTSEEDFSLAINTLKELDNVAFGGSRHLDISFNKSIDKEIVKYEKSISDIMAKHPAVLFLPIVELLNYLDSISD